MGAVPDTMFSNNLKPWHGIGTIVQGMLTAADALEASGLTWEVTREPIFNADMQEIPGFFSTTRKDTGKSLGVVGGRYAVINNVSAFDFVDAIIGDDSAKFETAGSLFGGKTVFIVACLPEDVKVAGDLIKPYFLLKNTHDGSGALKVVTTPVRVVCENTLNAALNTTARSFSIRHTSGYEDKLMAARNTLGLTRAYYASFVEFAENLVAQKFTRSSFEDLVKTLMPEPATQSARGTTNMIDLRDKMMNAYNAGDIDNVRGTKWGAYNAVADFSDHMRKLVGDVSIRRDNAFVRTFEATDLKDRALALLTN